MAIGVPYKGHTRGGMLAAMVPEGTSNYLVTSPGPASGVTIASGTGALDGTNPTPITTGLSTIIAAGAQLNQSAAPGVATSSLTVAWASVGGTLNVYGWKVTGTGDATLIASTGTDSITWWAIGT